MTRYLYGIARDHRAINNLRALIETFEIRVKAPEPILHKVTYHNKN